MKPLAIVGAVVGGAVGAAVWAVIAWKMNVEIGYVAWGVGFLVGTLSALLGGSGSVNGVLCAIITLLAIGGGKIGGSMIALPDVLRKELAKEGVPEENMDAAIKMATSRVQFSDYVEDVKSNLSVIDAIFAFLGVATAFKIGSSGRGHEQKTTVDPNRPVNLSGPAPGPSSPETPRGPVPAFGDPIPPGPIEPAKPPTPPQDETPQAPPPIPPQ